MFSVTSWGWTFPVPASHWVVGVRRTFSPQSGRQEIDTPWQCAILNIPTRLIICLGTQGVQLGKKRIQKASVSERHCHRIVPQGKCCKVVEGNTLSPASSCLPPTEAFSIHLIMTCGNESPLLGFLSFNLKGVKKSLFIVLIATASENSFSKSFCFSVPRYLVILGTG